MEDASTVGGRAAPVVGRRDALALVRPSYIDAFSQCDFEGRLLLRE